MNNANNNELIVEFQQGSQGRFKEIYNMFKIPLYQFVHNITQDHSQSEDIVSDCFINLWEKRMNFISINKIKAFLFVAAKNACMDYLRREQVKNKSQKELTFLLENEDFILAKMVKSEVLSQIYAEIEKLPPECKKIFKMLYIQGLNYKEIAEQLNLEESTIRNQKRRALKLMRTVIFNDKDLILLLMIYLN